MVDRIALMGMMGSGKSSVGRVMSERTGWPFVDNDALVQRATGSTARELLARHGLEALRDAESAALDEALAMPGPVIVAVAAGVVLDPVNRERLREAGFVVWLSAAAEELADRAVGAEHRPWLEGEDPVAWFRDTIEARRAMYTEVADLVIDTGSDTPAQAAERILTAYHRHHGT